MTISRKALLHGTGLSLLLTAGRRVAAAFGVTTIRWGIAVDAAKCARQDGCAKCVAACHQAHNVPVVPHARHEVRWIWKERFERVFRSQEVEYASIAGLPAMVLCNHCDNPPCVRVCPAQATWKREDGIVAMDWHRCIGCRYCIAACPYGARSFNWVDPRLYVRTPAPEFPTRTKGVVEKCTLCSERIGTSRQPACVEACPEKALVFGNLDDPGSEIRRLLASRFHIRRKPELGTRPGVFYIV